MVESTKKVCCCGARTWALVIGWLEVLGSPVHLYKKSVDLVNLNKIKNIPMDFEGYDERELEKHITIAKVLIAVGIISSIIQFVMAIVLITGVNQKKAGMVKAHLVWRVAGLVILGILGIVLTILMGFLSFVVIGIVFLVNVFIIWVVNVHLT